MKTFFATQLLTASVLGLQLTSYGKQGRSEENLPEMRPDNDHMGNFDLAQLGAEYIFQCSEPFDRLNGVKNSVVPDVAAVIAAGVPFTDSTYTKDQCMYKATGNYEWKRIGQVFPESQGYKIF